MEQEGADEHEMVLLLPFQQRSTLSSSYGMTCTLKGLPAPFINDVR